MENKKKKIQAVLIVVAVFVIILVIHTLQNINERLTPTSETWSHAKEIGVSSSGKAPFIAQGDDNHPVITFLADGKIETVSFNSNFKLDKEQVDTNGVSISDFVKHDQFLLFTSGGKLHSGTVAGGQLDSIEKISDESILNLSFTQSSNSTYAAAASPNGIRLYEMNTKGITEIGSVSDLPATEDFANKRIAGIQAENETLSLVVVSNYEQVKYAYHYVTFNIKNGQNQTVLLDDREVDPLTPYTYTDMDFVQSNDQIEVFTTYQFYKKGLFKRVSHFIFDLGSKQMVMNHKDVDVPYARDTLSNVEIHSVNPDGSLGIIVNMEAKTGREKAVNRMVELTLDQGKIKNTDYISSPYVYTRSASIINTEKGEYLTWLVKSGEKTFDVFLSGTSDAFYEHMSSIQQDMIVKSLYTVINSFVFSFLTLLVTGFWAVPALVFITAIEWIKSSIWVEDNIKIVLAISVVITIVTELIFFEGLFYKPGMVRYMPVWLSFTGAKLLYPIIIGAISYAATLIFKKSMEIPSALGLFTFFFVSNVMLLDILFAPYII